MPALIRYARLRPTAWKNGLGITRQIAIVPKHATLESFLWRISTAEVATESSFSSYPGIDRILVVATPGGQIRLSSMGQPARILTPELPAQPSPPIESGRLLSYAAPFRFQGEPPIHATLPHGALRDFNVMVRRGRAQAEIRIHDRATELTARNSWRLLHCLGAPVRLRDTDSSGTEFVLVPGDSLLWLPQDDIPSLALQEPDSNARLIDVCVTARDL